MYNSHRGIANNRTVELLDQIKVEFDSQEARAREYEHQSRAPTV
jgi:hypothetical protein